HSELGVRKMIAPLVVTNEAFAPASDPLERPLQATGSPAKGRFLGVMLSLVAEPAPNIRRDHPQGVLGNAELFGNEAAYFMWHLRRAVEGQSVPGRNRYDSPRFDGCADQPIIHEFDADHVSCSAQLLFDFGFVTPAPTEADVFSRRLMKLR